MLNSHLKSHSPECPYKCGQCSYTSKYKQPLYVHCVKMRHIQERGNNFEGKAEPTRINKVEKVVDEKHTITNKINTEKFNPQNIDKVFSNIQPATSPTNINLFQYLPTHYKDMIPNTLPSDILSSSHVVDNKLIKSLKPHFFLKPPWFIHNRTPIYPSKHNIEDILTFSSYFYHEIKKKLIEKDFQKQSDTSSIYNNPLDLRVTSKSE